MPRIPRSPNLGGGPQLLMPPRRASKASEYTDVLHVQIMGTATPRNLSHRDPHVSIRRREAPQAPPRASGPLGESSASPRRVHGEPGGARSCGGEEWGRREAAENPPKPLRRPFGESRLRVRGLILLANTDRADQERAGPGHRNGRRLESEGPDGLADTRGRSTEPQENESASEGHEDLHG